MNNQNIPGKVEALLSQKRFKDACLLLRRELRSMPVPELMTEIEQTENAYTSLLRYFVSGAPDPSRYDLLSDIYTRLLEVADRLDLRKSVADSPDMYHSLVRNRSLGGDSLETLLRRYSDYSEVAGLAADAGNDSLPYRRNREETLDRIFCHVWSLPHDSKDECEVLGRTAADGETDFNLAAQIVSALMLAVFCSFDSLKLRTLLRIYEDASSEKVAARALTAVLLIAHSYPGRISSDRRLRLAFESLADNIVNYARLRDLLMEIVRTRDTERVNDKVRSELLPGLMKMGPELMKKFREASEEMDLDGLEDNPAWNEALADNGLLDKLKDLTEMQLEGADVMMTAFSNLKSFSFFRKVSNWFLPFDPSHSCFSAGVNDSAYELSPVLELEDVMCDSDKYSFGLSLLQMPEAQRNAIKSGAMAQMDQMKETMEEQRLLQARPVFKQEVVRYLRDIYRFHKLFSRKTEFADPFLMPFNFLDIPGVGTLFQEPEILGLVAEFYFKRGYHRQALPMFRMLASAEGSEAWLWEKLGYCIERTDGNPEEALDCYVKAQLLGSSGKWIFKRMSDVCEALGNHERAALLLEDAMEADGEELPLILECASRHMLAGNKEKALAMFYKADYLSAENPEVWRFIANAELDGGNPEKADVYCRRLVALDSPSTDDMRLAGHIAFVGKKFQEAAGWYMKSIASGDANRKWKSEIIKDFPRLERNGASREELDLLMDWVLYQLEN